MSFTVRHVSSGKKKTNHVLLPKWSQAASHKNCMDFYSNLEPGEEKAESGSEGNKHL